MKDYFKRNPIPLHPRSRVTEKGRALGDYARGFKIKSSPYSVTGNKN